MAGDWIKMRTSLITNPKVNGVARALEDSCDVSRVLSTGFNGPMSEIVTRNVMRHVTVSSLLIVWGAANEHTENGVFKNADLSDIDDMVGIPGFGQALESVGWAEYDSQENTVTLPNFSEYNTSSASRGASSKSAAQRQKAYRERKKSQESDVTRDVTRDVTSDVTRDHREEKRREEGKPPISPVGEIPPPSESETGADLLSDKPQPLANPKPKPDPKGSRLPDGWVLPAAWGKWAMEDAAAQGVRVTAEEVRRTAEKFADYWRAKGGKEARKTDWQATWRNWWRKDVDDRNKPLSRSTSNDQRRSNIAKLTGQGSEPEQAGFILDGDARRVG